MGLETLSGNALSDPLELLRGYNAGHPGVLPAELQEDDVDVGAECARVLSEAVELKLAKAGPGSEPVTQDSTQPADAESLKAPCVPAASAVHN